MSSATNIDICNKQRLMTNFAKKLIRIGRFISNRVSLNRKKIKRRHGKKNSSKNLVLTLNNIFYLLNSSSNFIRLHFFNDIGIYHHNNNQIFYNKKTQKTLIFTQKYKTSFFLPLLNLFLVTINLFKRDQV